MFKEVKKIPKFIDEISKILKSEESSILLEVLNQDSIDKIITKIDKINEISPKFDFDENTPANGLRTFVKVCEDAFENIHTECLKFLNSRTNLFLTSNTKRLIDLAKIVKSLDYILDYLVETYVNDENVSNLTTMQDMKCLKNSKVYDLYRKMDLQPFYSYNMAFHQWPSTRRILIGYKTMLATVYEFLCSKDHVILKYLKFPFWFLRYFLLTESRSFKLVEVTENFTVKLLRSNLGILTNDFFIKMYRLVRPKVEVNESFLINPIKIHIEKINGEKFEVPLPMITHENGPKPIQCRLISNKMRKGMLGRKAQNSQELSRSLIFYVHGGGFIAARTLYAESYTLLTTNKLNVPIVGIDYRKSPEYPYPKAIEEVFYAYCWALKHPEYFGSTLERIVFMSESSGSSLVKCLIIKCIENEIRVPDHFVSVCGACRVDGSMTPSRMLSIFEPFLIMASVTMLLYCYTIGKEFKTLNEVVAQKDSDLVIPKGILLSPIFAKNEILKKFPKISFILASVDPFLDENIELAKRLHELGVDVTVKIIYGAQHTFLNFSEFSKECREGFNIFLSELKKNIL